MCKIIKVPEDYILSNFIPEIRDLPDTDNVHTIADGLLGYKYEITNKYYTVPVYLCPYSGGEDSLQNYPLLSKVEGFLIHFDTADKQFLTTKLSKYLSVADNCDPECKILLCDKLSEEEKDGVTFGELKQKCNLWDVIELSREAAEEDEEASTLNPVGYDELRDALQNIIWSNVEYSGSGEAETKACLINIALKLIHHHFRRPEQQRGHERVDCPADGSHVRRCG